MEVASLVLAVPALIQLFIETGKRVHDEIKSNKRLKEEVMEIRNLFLDDGRAQLDRDFQLVMLVLKDASTPEEERRRVHRLLAKSCGQLQAVHDQAKAVSQLEFWRRHSALKAIHEAFNDVKTSMQEFHQLVVSLHTIATSEALRFLGDQDFELTGPVAARQILNNDIVVSSGRVSSIFPYNGSKHGRFILERKSYKGRNASTAKKSLRILSQKLAVSDQMQGNGILPLVGFREEHADEEFQLVFGIPSVEAQLQTLQSVYAQRKPSLNFRVALCQQLAEAVLQTHKLGLVHKHIRPENILLLSRDGTPSPACFLIGWQYARVVDGSVTRLAGEILWERAIYQHPERQSEHVEAEYCMGHDIYSLGVCMLEILTWEPLVNPGEPQATLSQSYRALCEKQEPQEASDYMDTTDTDDDCYDDCTEDPEVVYHTLVRMCDLNIPPAAGERLRDLVRQCLTCLTEDDEMEHLFGVAERSNKEVAVSFVDTVLRDILKVTNAL